MPAPTWSASCSFRRRRATSGRGGAGAGRARAGPRAERSRSRSMPTTPRLARVEALKPDMLQLHGKETPERVAGCAAIQAAGDEGDPDRERPTCRRPAYARSPTGSCSTRARRATRRGPAASASRSTGGCWKISIPVCRSCCRAGSTPAMSPRPCASRARRRSMFPPASSARRARRTRKKFAPSFAPRERPTTLDAQELSRHDRAAAAQLVPHRARRARAFRHLRRPLRRRDADAAHSRAGEGLRATPRPTRRSSAKWTAI